MNESIIKEYLNGESIENLASKYNISKWTLLARFKKLNIRKTTKRHLNIYSFSEFSNSSCYWAGFIAADGYITKYTLGLELSIIDLNHLKKLKLFLNSNAEIKIRSKKSFGKISNYCLVQFNSVKLVDNLIKNFNLIYNKSLVLEPPYKIPEKFIKFFILGYIDGDGYIGWRGKYPRLIISSGSECFLNWIKINLNLKPKIIKRKKSNTFILECNGKKVNDILDNLYDSNIYLDRKFNFYMECKKYVSI